MPQESVPRRAVGVTLDGIAVEIPPERHSLAGVCAYLESLALRQQRILFSLVVNGESISLTELPSDVKSFTTIEAETMSLSEVPVQLISAALQQTISLRAQVQEALELVLINEGDRARELWWNLSFMLKEPVLTISLLPENAFGAGECQASLIQLRRWQLQQLGAVIEDVNYACEWDDATVLSDALEMRALPWLNKLQSSLELWRETMAVRRPRAA